ncbi:MAG: nucleotidyltransferase domain-containing protein, partial [Endomicrobiia bacterium]
MNNLTEKEKQAIKELVEGLKKLYGKNLTRVILYGSKARGDAVPDSDIDILVVLKNMKSGYDEISKI